MKWFKHDSSAHRDVKLKKLKQKYGIVGYGLYWYCIELIAFGVERNNITFELEDDAETIAIEWGLDQLKVQEMMQYMVNLKLFESDNGQITCLKLAKRLDDTNSKNPEIRRILALIDGSKQIGETPNNSETIGETPNHSESLRETPNDSEDLGDPPKDSAQIRLDKIRKEKDKTLKQTPNGGLGDYAFQGETFNITKKDFDRHKQSYPKLDLLGEYLQLDLELRETPKKQLWSALNAKLNYRNKNCQLANHPSGQQKLSTIETATRANAEYAARLQRQIDAESSDGYDQALAASH